MPTRWARLLAYVLLAGLVTGLIAGVATFGLPVRLPDTDDPHPLVARVLALGLGLDDAATILGAAVLVLILLVAWLDLRRAGRPRQP